MKSIFDSSFRYTPSFSTDLKKTFARVRNEQRRIQQQQSPAPAPRLGNVAVLGDEKRRRLGR
jgi:hypothetical protein